MFVEYSQVDYCSSRERVRFSHMPTFDNDTVMAVSNESLLCEMF